MLKKILREILNFFIIIFIAVLFLTLFNYFNLLNSSIISILKLIIPVVSLFITSYRLGKQSEKKGYMEGLKMGSLIIGIFTILILLLDEFQIKTLLYDLILLLTAVLSSMIGINRKRID